MTSSTGATGATGAKEATEPRVLWLTLPGVVSWRRPRASADGRARYPLGYQADREAWRTAVAAQVAGARWQPPAAAVQLTVTIHGGSRRFDPDRVLSAVLDALVAGGALRDDTHQYLQEITLRMHMQRKPTPTPTPQQHYCSVWITEAIFNED